MNPWTRSGLFYTCTLILVAAKPGYNLHVEKKLDIFSYHLIKWIHGEAKLIEMAKTLR